MADSSEHRPFHRNILRALTFCFGIGAECFPGSIINEFARASCIRIRKMVSRTRSRILVTIWRQVVPVITVRSVRENLSTGSFAPVHFIWKFIKHACADSKLNSCKHCSFRNKALNRPVLLHSQRTKFEYTDRISDFDSKIKHRRKKLHEKVSPYIIDLLFHKESSFCWLYRDYRNTSIPCVTRDDLSPRFCSRASVHYEFPIYNKSFERSSFIFFYDLQTRSFKLINVHAGETKVQREGG